MQRTPRDKAAIQSANVGKDAGGSAQLSPQRSGSNAVSEQGKWQVFSDSTGNERCSPCTAFSLFLLFPCSDAHGASGPVQERAIGRTEFAQYDGR